MCFLLALQAMAFPPDFSCNPSICDSCSCSLVDVRFAIVEQHTCDFLKFAMKDQGLQVDRKDFVDRTLESARLCAELVGINTEDFTPKWCRRLLRRHHGPWKDQKQMSTGNQVCTKRHHEEYENGQSESGQGNNGCIKNRPKKDGPNKEEHKKDGPGKNGPKKDVPSEIEPSEAVWQRKKRSCKERQSENGQSKYQDSKIKKASENGKRGQDNKKSKKEKLQCNNQPSPQTRNSDKHESN